MTSFADGDLGLRQADLSARSHNRTQAGILEVWSPSERYHEEFQSLDDDALILRAKDV